MKAIAVFPKEKAVRLIDHPEPHIESSTQVKLKIIEVGICGTDREICQFKYGTPPDNCDYLILGHESLGRVIEVGSDVTTIKPGDLAVVMVRRPCHHHSCMSCQVHRQDFCYTGDFKERGINGLHGFMSEYVVDDERYMLPVPAKLADIAVLTEPLTIAEKAVREIYCIQKRLPWGGNDPAHHQALIIGAGPVGLLAALAFEINQFTVSVYSLESTKDVRAQIAMTVGARYISAQSCDITQLNKQYASAMDVIFDGSGASRLAFQMFDLLGYNGIFVWTGIPGRKESIDVNAGTIMRNIVLKNQSILGTVNAGREDFLSAIHHLHDLSGRLTSASPALITRYHPEEFEALLLQPPAENVFKSVVRFE